MYWSLVISGALALFNIVRGRSRWLAACAFVLIALTLLLGAHKVEVGPAFPEGTAVQSGRTWPARYGVVGDCVPRGFWKQVVFPSVWKSRG